MRRIVRHVCSSLAVCCRALSQQQRQQPGGGQGAGDDGSDAAERDVLNSDTIYDIGSGSAYYFPPSLTRQHGVPDIGRLSRPASSASATEKPKRVRIAGPSRYYSLDVSTPPLSAEEAERWKLDRLLYTAAPSFLPNAAETRYLLLPSQQLTSLGPRMAQMERLYRLKGSFAPSEIAHVFVPITPTFFVESGHVMRAVPPNLLARIEHCMGRSTPVSFIFARYPMIFKVNRAAYRKTLVKLNLDFDFIRRYPGCGRGDKLHYHHNAERSALGAVVGKLNAEATRSSDGATTTAQTSAAAAASSRGIEAQRARGARRPIELQIFEILLRHLPRVPTPHTPAATTATSAAASTADANGGVSERQRQAAARMAELYAARYRALPLVQWVNSFSRDELAVLNTVPQQHVVNVMSRFVHVFQLVSEHGEDGNLYTDRDELLALYGPTASAVDYMNASPQKPAAASASTTDGAADKVAARRTTSGEHVAKAALSAAEQQRVQRFERSVQDDLIDLDETLAPRAADDDAVTADETGALPEEDDAAAGDDDDEAPPPLSSSPLSQQEAGQRNSARHDKVAEEDGEEDGNEEYVPTNFDGIAVRRLPPNIAPRSLSNFNERCSPDPDLVQLAAGMLAAPPTLAKYVNNYFARAADAEAARRGGATPRTAAWRWVRVERVYEALTPAQRHRLRRYKGLANFLRLHGELFELSADLRHYIAHDPLGTVAPLLPTQTRFGFEERVVLPRSFDDDPSAAAALIGETERRKYEAVLGACHIPCNRRQLILLDPHNPILQHNVLAEEVAQLLPDHPVTKTQALSRLPPVMRAAIGSHMNVFSHEQFFRTWVERGVGMVQRRDGRASAPHATADDSTADSSSTSTSSQAPAMTLEDAVEELTGLIPECGVSVRSLRRMHLSIVALEALKQQFGSLYNAICAFPQYFTVKQNGRYLDDSLVYLREDTQARSQL